jgi:ubiquinone/menaquinone biosynthesis C-methylase UbiE
MFFDRKADTYDRWYETKLGSFVDKVETELAFDLFDPQSGEKILDVGCGTGNFSLKLARQGCQVTGVDLSEAMLAKARKKVSAAGREIDFYHQDIKDLKFPEATFDGVISMATVEFVEEFEAAFAEMKRVTKPGGKILIGTIAGDSQWGAAYRKRAQEQETVFEHAHFKTQEGVNDLDSENLVASQECLFIPPDIEEEKIGWEAEEKLADVNKGGFFCSLWQKEE